MKKIISTLLSILMAFTCLTANTVFAENNTIDITLTYSDGSNPSEWTSYSAKINGSELQSTESVTLSWLPSEPCNGEGESRSCNFSNATETKNESSQYLLITYKNTDTNNEYNSSNLEYKFISANNSNSASGHFEDMQITENEKTIRGWIGINDLNNALNGADQEAENNLIVTLTKDISSIDLTTDFTAVIGDNDEKTKITLSWVKDAGENTYSSANNVNEATDLKISFDISGLSNISAGNTGFKVITSNGGYYTSGFSQNSNEQNILFGYVPMDFINGSQGGEGDLGNFDIMYDQVSLSIDASKALVDSVGNDVTWSSSDENVATVDKGVVTGVGAGTTTITASATDGGQQLDTCVVNVAESTNGKPTIITREHGDHLTAEYDGKKMLIGFANYSDGQTIHIDGGDDFDLSDEVIHTHYRTIGIAYVDDDGNVESEVENEYYGLLSLTLDNITSSDLTLEKSSNCETATGRNTYKISYIPSVTNVDAGYDKEFTLNVPLTFNGIPCSFDFIVMANKYNDKTVNLDGNLTTENLNKIVEGDTEYRNLTIELNQDLSGEITLDVSELSNKCKNLVIRGKNEKVKITGSLKITGGTLDIENIDFVASENDKGVGLEAVGNSDSSSDIFSVNNCTFTNYEYALKTTVGENKRGLISGLCDVTITNCKYGYYLDNLGGWNTYSDWDQGGSDITTTFVNCDYGIYIKNFPDNSSSFQFVMNNARFYGTKSYDIVNETSNTFFLSGFENNNVIYGNYYGKNYSDGIKNSNIRAAKVKNTNGGIVYTNLCIIDYLNGNYVLGVYDPDNNLKAAVKGDMSIDPTTITKQTTIEVLADDGQAVGAWSLSPKEAE